MQWLLNEVYYLLWAAAGQTYHTIYWIVFRVGRFYRWSNKHLYRFQQWLEPRITWEEDVEGLLSED